MNGVEVRIPQVLSRDTDLGTAGMSDENGGAVELWKDGVRIIELVWWEVDEVDLETLTRVKALKSALTYDRSISHRTTAVRS